MLNTLTFVDFLKVKTQQTLIPFNYKLGDPQRSAVVSITNSRHHKAHMFFVHVQVTCRSIHPAEAQQDIEEIKNILHNLTAAKIDGYYIIRVKSIAPVPLFLNEDKDGLFLFTHSYEFLMEKEKEVN